MINPSTRRTYDRRSLANLLVQIDSDLLRAQNGEEILSALRPALLHFRAKAVQLYFLYTDANNRPACARLVAALNHLGELIPLNQLPAQQFRLADYPFVAQTVVQRQPYFIENIFTHPQVDEAMRNLARTWDHAAVIALPLAINERWLGFLNIQWQKPQRFDDAMRIFFKTLQTNFAAVVQGHRSALEREEAYREIELLYRIGSAVNAAQSYDELVQAVGQHASLGAFSISITHFEHYDLEQATYAEIMAVWGAHPERVSRRIQDGAPLPFAIHYQPQIVSDVSQLNDSARQFLSACGYAAFLSVPLTFGETVLGALNFFSDKPRQYAPAELRLAKGIADLVAVAVDRIRLREASLRIQRRIERVAQINAALLMASDELDIVRTFAEYIEEMDAESVALSYFETSEPPHRLRTVAVCDKQGVRVHSRIPQPALLSDAFAATLRQQMLTFIEDVQQDALLSVRERDLLLKAGVRSLATLLLNSGGEWSGLLSIHWRQLRAFSADDRAVLEAVLPSLTAVVGRRQLWLKQAETLERLRQMDRLKDEFLSNMSHELRTPLNAVIGLSDVILQGMDGELTPRLQQDIQTIHDAGQQLLAIVNDVLDIAKIESGTLTLRLGAIDLRQPLQEALKTARVMAASKHLTLSAHLPDQPLMAQADANRMRQVALNLLSNAVKFTDVGNVRLYAYAQDGEVVFCVQDEGIGIAPEHHALIFEQFRQVEGSLHRRKGGAGLGLAISKRLVELHGGRIWLESALGKGATFYVSLPSL
jgi:signal transduction histidine kinase